MKNYLENIKQIIDTNIEKLFDENNEFEKMLKYATKGSAKRLRPAILYILADIYIKEYELIENEALALELIHSYSLVHDDMPCMDNDDYRRGKLTVHKKYGESNALLVGDALLTYAFNILSKSKTANKESFEILSRLAGKNELIYGQYLDMNYSKMNKDMLIETYIKKTATLFLASVKLAKISLGFSNQDLKKYESFFINLGIAYQINDDIEEYEENPNLEDEKTIVFLLGIDEAKKLKEQYLKVAINSLDKDNKLVDFLKYIMKKEN